ALRRRLSAPHRRGEPLSGAGSRARPRRAPGAAARRVRGGRPHVALLLRGRADPERRRLAAPSRSGRLTRIYHSRAMRYVVTGAAGFIGSQLLRTLVEGGHDAVGWDAFTDYYDPALKEENARGLPVERVDLAEDELDLDGVDGVFHLAGQPGVRSFGGIF